MLALGGVAASPAGGALAGAEPRLASSARRWRMVFSHWRFVAWSCSRFTLACSHARLVRLVKGGLGTRARGVASATSPRTSYLSASPTVSAPAPTTSP